MKTIPIFFAQPLVAHLGWTLLDFLWQGALISALYAAVRGLASRWMGTRARYSLACLSLAIMALAPIVTYGFLASHRWGSDSSAAQISPSQMASDGNVVPLAPWYSLGLDNLQRVLPWLVAAWFAGVVILLIRLVRGTLFAVHLRSRGTGPVHRPWDDAFQRIAARLGIVCSVRLVISSVVDVPVVVGWLRPVVLLPAAALTGMAPEHIEALLAHELAHVRRHDYLVNVLQRVVEALLFYHPAVWWMSGQIRKERELCCDDLAVTASGDRLSYAHALVGLELSRPAHAHTAVAANGGSLLARIRHLAEPSEPIPHAVFGPVAATAVALIVLFVAGAAVVKGAEASSAPVGEVSRNSIWVDTVRQGDMQLLADGPGTLTTNTTADLELPAPMLNEVKPGQTVLIQFDNPARTTAAGRVTAMSPGAKNGTVSVEISGALPPGVQQGASVVGAIHVGALKNVIWLARPAQSQPETTGYVFKLERDGKQAARVQVEFGRANVNSIEIRRGLAPGDKVIVSDNASFKRYDRITLK